MHAKDRHATAWPADGSNSELLRAHVPAVAVTKKYVGVPTDNGELTKSELFDIINHPGLWPVANIGITSIDCQFLQVRNFDNNLWRSWILYHYSACWLFPASLKCKTENHFYWIRSGQNCS
jgi:hypothetical protein